MSEHAGGQGFQLIKEQHARDSSTRPGEEPPSCPLRLCHKVQCSSSSGPCKALPPNHSMIKDMLWSESSGSQSLQANRTPQRATNAALAAPRPTLQHVHCPTSLAWRPVATFDSLVRWQCRAVFHSMFLVLKGSQADSVSG